MDRHLKPGSRAARDAAVVWFTRLRDPQLRASEQAAFAQWRDSDPAHAAAYAEVEAVWKQLDVVPAPAPLEAPGRRFRFVGTAVAAAAAIVMFAFGLMLLPPGGLYALLADTRTATGEIRAMRLPDGTEAWLDAGSALSFDIGPWERRVTLVAGRAYFRVHHEARPFVVAVDEARVRDIGTAFELARVDGGGQVVVSEGKVEVSVHGAPPTTLAAGEGASFDAKVHARQLISTRDVAAWRSRRLLFADAALSEVLADLERYGAGRIIVLDGDLQHRRITGAFDTHHPEAALAAILELAGARSWHLGPLTFVKPAR
ncbi:MAG: FecR domain-containing protein [Gammaproteobacteria bacterium]